MRAVQEGRACGQGSGLVLSRRVFLFSPLALLGAEKKPNVILVIARGWRGVATPWSDNTESRSESRRARGKRRRVSEGLRLRSANRSRAVGNPHGTLSARERRNHRRRGDAGGRSNARFRVGSGGGSE